MNKQTLTLALLVGGFTLTMTSCTYRGKCECDLGSIDVSTEEQEFDNKKDYDDAKEACEDVGCDWRVL